MTVRSPHPRVGVQQYTRGGGGLQKYFLTDCFVFYTSSVIFKSCNGGAKNIIYLNISVDVYSYLFQTIVHVYIKSHFLHHSLHQWSSSLCLHFKILILCTVHYCVEWRFLINTFNRFDNVPQCGGIWPKQEGLEANIPPQLWEECRKRMRGLSHQEWEGIFLPWTGQQWWQFLKPRIKNPKTRIMYQNQVHVRPQTCTPEEFI